MGLKYDISAPPPLPSFLYPIPLVSVGQVRPSAAAREGERGKKLREGLGTRNPILGKSHQMKKSAETEMFYNWIDPPPPPICYGKSGQNGHFAEKYVVKIPNILN